MVTCTTPPFRAAVRLNSGVRLNRYMPATLRILGTLSLLVAAISLAWAVWARWALPRVDCQWRSQLSNCVLGSTDVTAIVGGGLVLALLLFGAFFLLGAALFFIQSMNEYVKER